MSDDLQSITYFDPPHEIPLLDQIGKLRITAWCQRTGVSEEIKTKGKWLDDMDNSARHYILKNQASELIGAARVNFFDSVEKVDYISKFHFKKTMSGPIAVISRLVILKEFSHRKLGREFDLLRINQIREMCASGILAIAGFYRLNELKCMGFQLAGPPFSERELPNHVAFPVCNYLE
ncbi:GNAT family N-acyltransferase [Flexibacterium corallicola]|uniref:GNAT family N-acyltransferase n=1 Tax=Flexibacterium corallicola TaxID=3037259 RepID=UPI00286F304F|nr:GNAT family N-acyltransferase [Pseudovibrio sp. M1P-2-3]